MEFTWGYKSYAYTEQIKLEQRWIESIAKGKLKAFNTLPMCSLIIIVDCAMITLARIKLHFFSLSIFLFVSVFFFMKFPFGGIFSFSFNHLQIMPMLMLLPLPLSTPTSWLLLSSDWHYGIQWNNRFNGKCRILLSSFFILFAGFEELNVIFCKLCSYKPL